jgi:dienelactone hydrolase
MIRLGRPLHVPIPRGSAGLLREPVGVFVRLPRVIPVARLLAILASPPVRANVKGLLLVPEVIPSPAHPLSLFTPSPRRSLVHLSDGEADLYRPLALVGSAAAPGVVLIHGANPGGKDDPRIVGLAEALARAGRRVLVPQLSLRLQRLDVADPSRIREAVSLLAGPTPAKVGVLAFSYGAGLTLVALADEPAVQAHVAFVATVGTYFSLFDLLQGAATGTVPYRGTTVSWQPDPQARELAAEQLAAFLAPADGAALAASLKRGDPTGLAPGPRSVYDLLANRDPARFDVLAGRLPGGLTDRLSALSPAQSINRVTVPVLALHARTDPASPPTESRLLIAALEGRVATRLVIVGDLSHVTPTASILRDIRDALRVADFASTAMRAQEGWPRP